MKCRRYWNTFTINIKAVHRTIFLSLTLISISIASWGQNLTKYDSLDLMIGQMIMVGMQGNTLEDDKGVLEDLKNGLIGGVILYEKNIQASDPWVSLKNLSYTIQNTSKYPAFIAIDQEGGKVNRLKTKYGFPPSKTAQYLGDVDDLDSTRFYAQLTASTLKGLGINVNFAPDVDLNLNPGNPIIGKVGRSYSSDPYIVAKHSSVVVEEHRKLGILTSLKHFPGHGSSESDTHLDMVDVSRTWQSTEVIPYQVMIEEGMVDGIMTAHIINENLDSLKLPGTLSKQIVTGLLRDSLNYEGIIFSDDMHMKAISDHYGFETAIELSLNAGLDVLLFSNNIAATNETAGSVAHSIIKNLVISGKIDYNRIQKSYQRILFAKQKIGLVN